MRVALVHDYLNQFGGAERVLLTLAEMFPQAPIYTLFYEPRIFGEYFEGKKIVPSFVNRAFIRRNHRLFIPLFPQATSRLDLGDKYDLIISDPSGFTKGITRSSGIHISYTHTPLRYAWEPEEYLATLLPKALIKLASPIISYLRQWDYKAAQKPDLLLANSKYTAEGIKKFYKRDAEVVYPPVDTSIFYPEKNITKKYFLAFGRFIHYKRFDLVVRAFNKLGLPLKIVGSGPEENKIRELIQSNKIELTPSIREEDQLRRVINEAYALIFPQVEHFGLVAVEALACGTPVVAYSAGGALEIVEEGKNGLFFNEQTEESIIEAVNRFKKMNFDQAKIVQSAQKFSQESFKRELREAINSAL